MIDCKLIVLLNGDVLVSEIEEVSTQLGEPDCKLICPYVLVSDKITQVIMETHNTESINLVSWLSNYTNENVIMIHSDKILTITEPKGYIKDRYAQLRERVE